MSEPFLGEIKLVGFNFAPRNWADCDGQILSINQNQSLYSLLGTTYGGDGRTSFALPDLRGRVPMHLGNTHSLGEKAGIEQVHLTTNEIPPHRHGILGTSNDATTPIATGNVLARSPGLPYAPADELVALHPATMSGGVAGQSHDNMQPSLTLRWIIALQGLFPSRN